MNLEPALKNKNEKTGASPKSMVRKDFDQYLKHRRRVRGEEQAANAGVAKRLLCVDEDKVANSGEAQPVDEEGSKALSPMSDLSDSASAESDVVAGLYFLLAASLRPESEGESADARPASAVACPSLESDAEDESVGFK